MVPIKNLTKQYDENMGRVQIGACLIDSERSSIRNVSTISENLDENLNLLQQQKKINFNSFEVLEFNNQDGVTFFL